MRGAGGALCVAVAALLVCCNADPHQDVEGNGERTAEHYDPGHKNGDLDHQESGNLVRQVRETGHGLIPFLMARQYSSPYGSGMGAGASKHELWPVAPPEYGGYYGDGLPKRNFDEIDRSGLNTFIKKRNFDEIDQTSMPFPYAAKRFYRPYSSNHFDIDMPVSSFDKKRFRPDYPMDEIDLSHFPIGSKRSQNGLFHPLR